MQQNESISSPLVQPRSRQNNWLTAQRELNPPQSQRKTPLSPLNRTETSRAARCMKTPMRWHSLSHFPLLTWNEKKRIINVVLLRQPPLPFHQTPYIPHPLRKRLIQCHHYFGVLPQFLQDLVFLLPRCIHVKLQHAWGRSDPRN